MWTTGYNQSSPDYPNHFTKEAFLHAALFVLFLHTAKFVWTATAVRHPIN